MDEKDIKNIKNAVKKCGGYNKDWDDDFWFNIYNYRYPDEVSQVLKELESKEE